MAPGDSSYQTTPADVYAMYVSMGSTPEQASQLSGYYAPSVDPARAAAEQSWIDSMSAPTGWSSLQSYWQNPIGVSNQYGFDPYAEVGIDPYFSSNYLEPLYNPAPYSGVRELGLYGTTAKNLGVAPYEAGKFFSDYAQASGAPGWGDAWRYDIQGAAASQLLDKYKPDWRSNPKIFDWWNNYSTQLGEAGQKWSEANDDNFGWGDVMQIVGLAGLVLGGGAALGGLFGAAGAFGGAAGLGAEAAGALGAEGAFGVADLAGAGGAFDMGAGFGGNTFNAMGLDYAVPNITGVGTIDSALAQWNSLPQYQQQLIQQAGKTGLQAASGQDIDPLKVALGAIGPIADVAAAGGDFGFSGFGGGEMADVADIGSESWLDSVRSAPVMGEGDADFSNLFSPSSYVNQTGFMGAPDLESALAATSSPVYGDVASTLADAAAGMDAYGAGEFGANDYAASEGATMQSVDEAIPAGQETFGDDYGANPPVEDASATGFNIKPSTLINMALKFLGGEGGAGSRAQRDALKKVTERTYKNEAERQAAYSAYAQELLGYVPSVSEAYAMDPQNVHTQFGDTFVDEKTGEVRYTLTPGTQQYFDALMQHSKETLDKGLGLDTDKLTAEQLEKAIASLQGKRDKDMATLTRALYARGLLGLIMYKESGTNLLTGETESWDLAEGQGANPYFAAELARRERENYQLANKSRGEAEDYMTKLLNHSGGLFGKAKDVDRSMIAALFDSGTYTDRAGEAKKRQGKGLFDLVAGPKGAYMQQLMGSLPSGMAASGIADADLIEKAQRDEAIRRFMESQGY